MREFSATRVVAGTTLESNGAEVRRAGVHIRDAADFTFTAPAANASSHVLLV